MLLFFVEKCENLLHCKFLHFSNKKKQGICNINDYTLIKHKLTMSLISNKQHLDNLVGNFVVLSKCKGSVIHAI